MEENAGRPGCAEQPGRPDLYVCHTAYQTFISCIRAMRTAQKPDILLGAGALPGARGLGERLVSSGLFRQVMLFDEQGGTPPLYKNPLAVLLAQHPMHRRYIEQKRGLRVDWHRYGRVYFYNDWNDLARYAQDCGARYILCEDAFSGHTLPEHPWRKQQAAEPGYRLRRALGYGYLYWGAYKGTAAIETECLAKTGPWADNFIEDSKAALFASVREAEKPVLARIFVAAPLPKEAPNPLLLLTRPFLDDGLVPDADAQRAVFAGVLARYGQGYTVFIKPHPRDAVEYGGAFPDAILLDKNMPSEVLNVAFPFRFARAVTVGSTALNTLTCADEKLMLPQEEFLAPGAAEDYMRRMLRSEG